MKKLLFLYLCSFPIICYAEATPDFLEQPMDTLRNAHVENELSFTKFGKTIFSAPLTPKSERINVLFETKEHVKPNYFQTIKRMDLATCKTGEVQLDTICQTTQFHYQNYLSAVAKNLTSQQLAHFYTLHKQAVEHYVSVYQLTAHQTF